MSVGSQRRQLLVLTLLLVVLAAVGWRNRAALIGYSDVATSRGPEWERRHLRQAAELAEQPAAVWFVGDSITDRWLEAGHASWERSFAPLGAVNLGSSGDGTQHLLWRLEHLPEGVAAPRAAVVLIGTNNTEPGLFSPEQIAAGVAASVAALRARFPDCKVVLLAVLPRDFAPSGRRDKIAAVNRQIARLADGKQVVWLDTSALFLAADGKALRRDRMPDGLHLSAAGYEAWEAPILAALQPLLRGSVP